VINGRNALTLSVGCWQGHSAFQNPSLAVTGFPRRTVILLVWHKMPVEM